MQRTNRKKNPTIDYQNWSTELRNGSAGHQQVQRFDAGASARAATAEVGSVRADDLVAKS